MTDSNFYGGPSLDESLLEESSDLIKEIHEDTPHITQEQNIEHRQNNTQQSLQMLLQKTSGVLGLSLMAPGIHLNEMDRMVREQYAQLLEEERKEALKKRNEDTYKFDLEHPDNLLLEEWIEPEEDLY